MMNNKGTRGFEQETTSGPRLQMDDVMITVCCLTYNHEKYIGQCLDGILSQKTDFKFELIVHDDASTDSTAHIIEEYAEKYPNTIRKIIQTQNQRSQHVPIYRKHILQHVKGQYIAFCEGDDFWTDPFKLQKQYDSIIKYDNCHMCVHKTAIVYESGEDSGLALPNDPIHSGLLESGSFINIISKGYSFHTSSFLVKTEKWKEYTLNPPQFRRVSDVGDEPCLLYFGAIGDVYYIDDVMSCYRRGVGVSWTNKRRLDHSGKHESATYSMLKEFDAFTGMRFHEQIKNRKALYHFKESVLKGQCRSVIKTDSFKDLSTKNQIVCLFGAVFPKTLRQSYTRKLDRQYKKLGYN